MPFTGSVFKRRHNSSVPPYSESIFSRASCPRNYIFLVDKSQLTNKSIEIFFMSRPFVRSIMSMSSTQIYLGLELVEKHMM